MTLPLLTRSLSPVRAESGRVTRMRGVAILLGILVLAGAAEATLYAPMDEATLVAASAAIVTGTVTASAPRRIDGRIVTETTVVVDRVYKGAIGGMSVTVTTPGGEVDGERAVVFGAPSFVADEAVLLFLQESPAGEVRTTALALGAYRLETAVDGTILATRMIPTRETRRLDDIAATAQALGDPGSDVGTTDPDGSGTPVTAYFTLLGSPPGRWFQADSGQAVRYAVANADVQLGSAVSDSVVDAAMAAWTDVPTASIVLERGGSASTGPSIAGGKCDGRSVVQFNDPANEIGSLSNCSGILAVGGFCTKSTTGQFNGQTFARISEGDLTVNNGLADCFPRRRDYEEIVTHEIGHSIGLGHSSENPNEPDPVLRDATMYFLAHLDGRGASLRADDVAAVSFVYKIENDPNDLDGDGVANDADACPQTPAGRAVDTNGCACGEAGHVTCDDGLLCTTDGCNSSVGRCDSAPSDCTHGDPCLTGSCDEQSGCMTAAVTGDAAVLCVYRRAYPPAACGSERVPRVVRKLLRRAARLAEKGLTLDDVRKLRAADHKLARARKAIDRAARRKRKPQGAVCASALAALVDDARARLPL